MAKCESGSALHVENHGITHFPGVFAVLGRDGLAVRIGFASSASASLPTGTVGCRGAPCSLAVMITENGTYRHRPRPTARSTYEKTARDSKVIVRASATSINWNQK